MSGGGGSSSSNAGGLKDGARSICIGLERAFPLGPLRWAVGGLARPGLVGPFAGGWLSFAAFSAFIVGYSTGELRLLVAPGHPQS